MDMEYKEGETPLDPEEKEGCRFPHIKTRAELDLLEQENITQGIAWLRRSRPGNIFSEQFACRVHKMLFGDVWSWAGTFRRTGKNIGVDPVQIGMELRSLLDDARYWIEQNTYAPIEIAARFHHRLVFIHPFPNGNGRHSRIMTDFIFERFYGDERPINWTNGDDLQQDTERRKVYIAALRAADQYDYSALLEFMDSDSGNK